MNSQDYNEEGRDLWNRKAEYWDEKFGDSGNLFHRQLVEPSLLKLLGLSAGEAVLDACCGNGVMSRRLAQQGARVTAIDFSEEMLRRARLRPLPDAGTLDYMLLDATDEAALLALGTRRFDAVVCSMALMDIPEVAPLFRAAAALLRPAGRFVFATMHPAFNSNNPVFLHKKEDHDGEVRDIYALSLRYYLDMPPVLGAGMPGEPSAHYYFHRSFSELLGAAFTAGFVLDGMLEPAFAADESAEDHSLSWRDFPQFPPVLSCRLRLG